jgi:hypothetical protein
MVDLSINYCIDLRNGRCSSLDRQQREANQQQQHREASEEVGAGHDTSNRGRDVELNAYRESTQANQSSL